MERLDLAWKEFAILKSKNLFYILTGCEFPTLIMTCTLFNDRTLHVRISNVDNDLHPLDDRKLRVQISNVDNDLHPL